MSEQLRCPRCGNTEDFDLDFLPTIYCNKCFFGWPEYEDPDHFWLIRARRNKTLGIWKEGWIDPEPKEAPP